VLPDPKLSIPSNYSSIKFEMYKKFEGPSWFEYIQWGNVIDAIGNCNLSAVSASRWGGRDKDCWNQLDCALAAADASQQAQYSSAATVLGLVSIFEDNER
jgi:hypothetical protein